MGLMCVKWRTPHHKYGGYKYDSNKYGDNKYGGYKYDSNKYGDNK